MWTTFAGLVVNMLLAAIKFGAGIVGHSQALLADAVESLADIFSSVVVWRGLVVAASPADEDHPYGHGKAEPLAAAVVSTMLLIAAGWIAITSFAEIRRPHLMPEPFTLFILAGVIVVKETLFRLVRRLGLAEQSVALEADAWHHRSDAITSLAAGIGISVALIGGPRFAVADDVAAIFAAGVIAWNGWRLLRPALAELMDRSPSREFVDGVRTVAGSIEGVEYVEKCFVRKMGRRYFVDLHAHVDPQLTVDHAHQIAHRVKDCIRKELPVIADVLVHIEPAGRQEPPAPH